MEREKDPPPLGDYQWGIEVMNRLWGEETTERMRAIWKQADPEVER